MEEDAAAFGKVIEVQLPEQSGFNLSYDCGLAVEVFLACCTQWVYTEGQAIGLNYVVLFKLFKLYRIKKKKQKDFLEEIQALERGARNCFKESREREKSNTD